MQSSPTLLKGEWPILDLASPVPSSIMDSISTDVTGSAITKNLGYLSLGHFFIDVSLLEQHATQRAIDPQHAGSLSFMFETSGVNREENPGVVIGLGEGWNKMKNNGPEKYRITPEFEHLHKLSLEPNGPIASVIRGGHRTEAMRIFTKDNEDKSDAYWCYNVLLPSKFFLKKKKHFFLKHFKSPTPFHINFYSTIPALIICKNSLNQMHTTP